MLTRSVHDVSMYVRCITAFLWIYNIFPGTISEGCLPKFDKCPAASLMKHTSCSVFWQKVAIMALSPWRPLPFQKHQFAPETYLQKWCSLNMLLHLLLRHRAKSYVAQNEHSLTVFSSGSEVGCTLKRLWHLQTGYGEVLISASHNSSLNAMLH